MNNVDFVAAGTEQLRSKFTDLIRVLFCPATRSRSVENENKQKNKYAVRLAAVFPVSGGTEARRSTPAVWPVGARARVDATW